MKVAGFMNRWNVRHVMKFPRFFVCVLGLVVLWGCHPAEEPGTPSSSQEAPLPAVSEDALVEEIKSLFESQDFELLLEKTASLRRLTSEADLEPDIAKIEGESLYLLAGAQWQQGLLEEAFGSLDRAGRIFEGLKLEKELGHALELKAVVAHEKGDLGGAETHYALAGERYRALDLQEGLGRVLLGQATIACERGMPSASVEPLTEAKRIFEEVDFQAGLGGAWIQDGIRLHLMGDLPGAEERYRAALDLLQANKRYRASILANLGEVDLEMGRLGTSLETFQSARDLHRELQDPLWVAYSELRMVESLAALGRFSEARRVYQSIDLREVGDQIIQAQLAMARNRLSLYEMDFEGADARSNQAIQVFEDYGRPDDLALAQLQFGHLLAMQGQTEQAHQQLDAARERVGVTESLKVKAAYRRLDWVLRLGAPDAGRLSPTLEDFQGFWGQGISQHHQLELFGTLVAATRTAGTAQHEAWVEVLQQELQGRFAAGEFSALIEVLDL